MIRYRLICNHDHEFESWFSKGADFEQQGSRGLVSCPVCGSLKVEKAIMSPAVAKTRASGPDTLSVTAEMQSKMLKLAEKIRTEIGSTCEDVGEKFAEEARAIHYGEKDARPIYGKASTKEAANLTAEGVTIAPIPEALVPPKKTDLN